MSGRESGESVRRICSGLDELDQYAAGILRVNEVDARVGGAAARLAQDCITRVDVLEYPELGMEAVWKIEVRDFPAFIVMDDKGNDFFADPSGPVLQIGAHP